MATSTVLSRSFVQTVVGFPSLTYKEPKMGWRRIQIWANFHVLVPVRFLNGWKTGDIIQKMGDVTYFMEGYFYVGCQFISISYFLTKFD